MVALNQKDKHGNTVFQRLVVYKDIVEFIRNKVSKKTFFCILRTINAEKNSSFHLAAKQELILPIFLSTITKDNYHILFQKNNKGETVFDLASNRPKNKKLLLDSLPIEGKHQALGLKNKEGNFIYDTDLLSDCDQALLKNKKEKKSPHHWTFYHKNNGSYLMI